MRLVIFITSVIIIVFLQVSFLPQLEIFHTIPNLILVFTIAWAIAGNYEKAILCGVLGGLLLDLFSPFYFGAIALCNLGIIAIIYFISQNFINNDDKFSIASICIISTIIYNIFLIFLILISKLSKLTSIIQPMNLQFIFSIFIQAILNTIILLLIYNFIKSVQSLHIYYEKRKQIKA